MHTGKYLLGVLSLQWANTTRKGILHKEQGMAFREKVLETHRPASDPTAAVSFGPREDLGSPPTPVATLH